jgi:hypothetical protein
MDVFDRRAVPLEKQARLGRFHGDWLDAGPAQGHLARQGSGRVLRTRRVPNMGENILPKDTET